MIFYATFFSIIMVIFQSCSVKGANDPFSLAPKKNNTPWTPPAKDKRMSTPKLIDDDLHNEVEKYSKALCLSLAEIIDIALIQSPLTKQSWAAARSSAAAYGQSLQDLFVLADIDSFYSRERSTNILGDLSSTFFTTEYGGDVSLSYIILDFGQIRDTSEAALQSLIDADWTHNSQIQQTIQTVTTEYYDYLYQKKLLQARKQDVLDAEVSLKATSEKFEQGLADISDVVQAKTNTLSQQLNVVTQKQTLHTSYTTLVATIGLPANRVFHFQDYPSKNFNIKLETISNLLEEASKNRPDLLAAEANVKSAVSTLSAAKKQKYPTVSSEFDFGKYFYQDGISDPGIHFNAQVSLSYPLFQGFYIDNTIKKAQASISTAQANLQLVQLDIIKEISNYRNNIKCAQESIDYAESYLNSAQEEFKVNLKKYQVGTGNIINLISAQTSVSDARAQLAQAQNNFFTSVANLSFATGILKTAKKSEQKTSYFDQLKTQQEEKDYE